MEESVFHNENAIKKLESPQAILYHFGMIIGLHQAIL